MPSIVEIKAHARSLEELGRTVSVMSHSDGDQLRQEDVFFKVPRGRLKLRIQAPDTGELIFYDRENVAGPKVTSYTISRTNEPRTLQTVLSAALGVLGVVRKIRHWFLIGQTRIHLDDVENLGTFIELEVALQPGQTFEAAVKIAEELMQKLNISPADLVEGAYLDLLLQRVQGNYSNGVNR